MNQSIEAEEKGGPDQKRARKGTEGHVEVLADRVEGGDVDREVVAQANEDVTVAIPKTDCDGNYPDSGSDGSYGTLTPEEERALALELSRGYGPPGIEYDTSPERDLGTDAKRGVTTPGAGKVARVLGTSTGSMIDACVLGTDSEIHDSGARWVEDGRVLGAAAKRKL
jgi:hypothetical protein